jgi:cyclic pyranopterin phosphate synthase
MNVPAEGLTDRFGRNIDYLRISVTERCDLRCAYCHPGRHVAADSADVLSADDVAVIGAAAVRLGIRRIRLTGGEPLLRPDLEHIVGRLSLLPGLADLALTTNGQVLSERAEALAAAGLRRVNVSLDSLDPEVYAAITGGGDVAAVLSGLDAALTAGLAPVKVNAVLAGRAPLGAGDLSELVALVRRRPVHVRFIEAMPTCSHAAYLPAEGVLEQLSKFGTLVPVPGPEGAGPARYFQLDGSQGMLGVITPLSEPFCDRCNRLRVSARGDLLPCLFSPQGISLLPALRGDDPVRDLMSLLREGAAAKPLRYGDIATPSGVVAMHVIGG